jgi:hypothetical protein
MKRILISAAIVLIYNSVLAQEQDPVHWQFKTVKIGSDLYELHFQAYINMPWHIYSQDNNDDITLPTSMDYNKSPVVEIVGKPKETGELQRESVSGTTVKYYENQVEFIQTVRLKATVKTNFSGKINYMACTGGRCLPPAERHFSFSLQ